MWSAGSKGVVWGAYDNDGQLDLYISRLNPEESNLIFHNQRSGRFADVTATAGVARATL